MTTLREAAQMALDALNSDNPDIQLRAATHLRAALAQPEQEPVAWCFKESTGNLFGFTTELFDDEEQASNLVPLYTAPPQREWVGLTDEEMRQAAQAMDAEPLAEGWKELVKFARAIEAKLREKNFDRPS